MTTPETYEKRKKMLHTGIYDIVVTKTPADMKHEFEEKEHFSQESANTYMGDGGETFQVTGLGYNNPSILEKYDIKYPNELDGVYGTIGIIQYAQNIDKKFERLVMAISQVGCVDIIRENNKFKDGPNWARPALDICRLNLNATTDRGLEKIIPQLSVNAQRIINDFIKYKIK